MPRERDGFVPLGDVADAVELSGDRVLARRADTPPARRHFTRLDLWVRRRRRRREGCGSLSPRRF